MKIIDTRIDENGFVRLFAYEEDIVSIGHSTERDTERLMMANEKSITVVDAVINYVVSKVNKLDVYFNQPIYDYAISVKKLEINNVDYFLANNSTFGGSEVIDNFKYVRDDLTEITKTVYENLESDGNILRDFIYQLLNSAIVTQSFSKKDVQLLYFINNTHKEAYKLYLTTPGKYVTPEFAKKHSNANCPELTEEVLKNFQSNTTLYTHLLESQTEMFEYIKRKFKLTKNNINLFRIFVDVALYDNGIDAYLCRNFFRQEGFMHQYVKDANNFKEALFPRYNNYSKGVRDKVEKTLEDRYGMPIQEIYQNRTSYQGVYNTLRALRSNTILKDFKLKCEVY